jgi:hypothetical protein
VPPSDTRLVVTAIFHGGCPPQDSSSQNTSLISYGEQAQTQTVGGEGCRLAIKGGVVPLYSTVDVHRGIKQSAPAFYRTAEPQTQTLVGGVPPIDEKLARGR